MQPNQSALSMIKRIAAKEVTLFFASPIAYLFLATFAAVTLFVFFWGEAFFARNIADVRPLFEWMPLLLVFLCSTLTMRLWSEERRSGTLEHVLTQPVPLWQFVVGKFAGCKALLGIALLITLPLPITVSIIGDLDWGPVIAGYLAAFLLGQAYLAVGLFVSARSDNQIVSLISATALCGLLYLIGTPILTDFFGNQVADGLRLLGTGSRFDSITRGVIDLRDLYYYLSIIAVFIALNTYVLEKERWAKGTGNSHHRLWRNVTILLVANAIGANFWLGQINSLRIDVTEGKQYSISDATDNYLNQLQEPLLLRGYFSGKTHPLLSPLVPQLKDLMREYEIAGKGRVRVEFIDPVTNPELEEEANQKFGIQPVPFQVEDRYQSSIVSSYFNVLVQYGDEYKVLGFQELIEVRARSEGEVDVQLRNPEHDLTRAVRSVLGTYQAGGNLFDTVKGELTFTAYVSAAEKLPEQLQVFRGTLQNIAEKYQAQSGGRLAFNMIDPDAGNGEVANQIQQDYGFQPMATSLFGDDSFYFYLLLSNGETLIQLPLDDVSEASFERNFEAGIKRFATGFTKTIALVAPQVNPQMMQMGMGGPQFNALNQFLSAELNVQQEDLNDGTISGEADILVLAAPEILTEKQLFAVDQFLMKGGTVVAATSPYIVNIGRRLDARPEQNELHKWLSHHGLNLQQKFVLDSQNAAFPVPVTRDVGGFQMQEMHMLDYPFFIDVRGDGLNEDNAITADLRQLTIPWAVPISVDQEKQAEREVIELVRSSSSSWVTESNVIMPVMGDDGLSAFKPEGELGSQLVGVISQGKFDSYFTGKQSPLLEESAEPEEGEDNAPQETISGVIEKSPESARIILFSSGDFLRDQVIRLTSAANRTEYMNTLQLVANAVDWSLDDSGLLSIRSRGHFNRTLPPMEQSSQMFWEYLNYCLAAIALGVVAFIQHRRKRSREQRYAQLLAN